MLYAIRSRGGERAVNDVQETLQFLAEKGTYFGNPWDHDWIIPYNLLKQFNNIKTGSWYGPCSQLPWGKDRHPQNNKSQVCERGTELSRGFFLGGPNRILPRASHVRRAEQ